MRDPVTNERRAARAAAPRDQVLPPSHGLEVLREDRTEEPYRPDLVARLERAVRLGRYRPDARAIADALVRRIDALES